MRDEVDAPAPDVLIRRGSDVVARTLDSETVVYAGSTGRVLVLDTLGTELWSLVAQPVHLGALCESLARNYSTEVSTVARDLQNPLTLLLESEVLVAEAITTAS
jgi:hypothetical protein